MTFHPIADHHPRQLHGSPLASFTTDVHHVIGLIIATIVDTAWLRVVVYSSLRGVSKVEEGTTQPTMTTVFSGLIQTFKIWRTRWRAVLGGELTGGGGLPTYVP
jgi:hypothetical protein